MTGQQMADRINQSGFGFRVERPTRGWTTPWIVVDKQTGQATPMTHRGLLDKHLQLFGISDAARTLASIRTPARVAASRANGRKGGRPRTRKEGASGQRFQIESKKSGEILGVYQGETPQDALDAMARDAGYRDAADAIAQSGDDGSHLIVTDVGAAARALVRTEAKAAASRANGRKGGRPRKQG